MDNVDACHATGESALADGRVKPLTKPARAKSGEIVKKRFRSLREQMTEARMRAMNESYQRLPSAHADSPIISHSCAPDYARAASGATICRLLAQTRRWRLMS